MVAVDYIGDPAGYDAQDGRRPVALPDSATSVAEQRERQVVPAREGGVPVGRVGADPDHLGASLGEDLIAVPECARLSGATPGVVLGVEVQHHDPPAEPVAEPDLFS
jgi:hypothetical protein